MRRLVGARASNVDALAGVASRSASAAVRCAGLVQELVGCTGTTPPLLGQWLIRCGSYFPLASVEEEPTKWVVSVEGVALGVLLCSSLFVRGLRAPQRMGVPDLRKKMKLLLFSSWQDLCQ